MKKDNRTESEKRKDRGLAELDRLNASKAPPGDGAGEQEFDYPAAARAIAIWLNEFCDIGLPYPEMVAYAARKASAALDEKDKEISLLRKEIALLKKYRRLG